jgi:5-(carboxyamino)imidazole ribonucleotide mutase
MGSKADVEWSKEIAKALETFGIKSTLRVASAHKVPLKCYELIKKYEKEGVVFITVAGRSNALSGFVDAQTFCPVIACPPYGQKFSGSDVFSSLSMPSGVAPMVVLEPKNAALAVAKIFSLADEHTKQKVKEYQEKLRDALANDDIEVAGNE